MSTIDYRESAAGHSLVARAARHFVTHIAHSIHHLRMQAARAVRHYRARRDIAVLGGLDARELKDLGLTRSEVTSMVAELYGEAPATRRQTQLAFH